MTTLDTLLHIPLKTLSTLGDVLNARIVLVLIRAMKIQFTTNVKPTKLAQIIQVVLRDSLRQD